MPNWCYNKVQIDFPHPKIKESFMNRFFAFPAIYSDDFMERHQLKRIVERKYYCMNGLYPVPLMIKAVGFDKAGYDWQCDNWGTKWDFFLTKEDIKETGNSISFYVKTAWEPPIGFLEYVSKLYPDIKISLSFDEESKAFVGEFLYDPVGGDFIIIKIPRSFGRKFYEYILNNRGSLGDYFEYNNPEYAEEYDYIDYIKCEKCGEVSDIRIYKEFRGKCTRCDTQILLPIVERKGI